MAQVKIYARRAHLERVRGALSDAIHGVLQDTLGLPVDKRFHRFIALEGGDFVHPPDRGEGYTILALVMFEGRSEENKARLPAPPDGGRAADNRHPGKRP